MGTRSLQVNSLINAIGIPSDRLSQVIETKRDSDGARGEQKGSGSLISKKVFGKLAREIVQGIQSDCEISREALRALQEATEAFGISVLASKFALPDCIT